MIEDQLKQLREKVSSLGWLVSAAISSAVMSLLTHDELLAQSVVANDTKIDGMDVEIEKDCVHLLETYCPIGSCLRLILAVIKIDNELERIGDLAENVALVALNLADCEHFKALRGCGELADIAVSMLKMSLQSLVESNGSLARRVLAKDLEVDRLERLLRGRIMEEIAMRAEHADPLVQLLHVLRQLERIGDLSTNVAEHVIFMIEGSIVRHRVIDGRIVRDAPLAVGDIHPIADAHSDAV